MKVRSKTKKEDRESSHISLGDFIRIRQNILPKAETNHERIAHDQKLKEISKVRMRNWPDSIELAKKNKLEKRKNDFIEKEMMKRKIDEEERKFQEINKQHVIERASKLLFDSQDAVKSFHSKLAVADAYKEREFQKEIQKAKEQMEREIEEDYARMHQQKLQEYDQKELEKKEADLLRKQELIHIINSQLKDSKIKKIKDYQDRVIEGQIIKKRALEELEEEKLKELEKKRLNDILKEEFVKANLELERMKEDKKLKEQAEERKIEEFAIKKQQLVDLRKKKENEKFQEKQKKRQQIIDKQIEHLKNLKNKEEEILVKQVKEAEVKRENELAEKQRKFQEMKVS